MRIVNSLGFGTEHEVYHAWFDLYFVSKLVRPWRLVVLRHHKPGIGLQIKAMHII